MSTLSNQDKQVVGKWLIFTVFMLIIQILLGGITRLTDSGLSITEWKLVLGTIPPLNQKQWLEAFEAYKGIPQYEALNDTMTLTQFKWIYFWEYIHRLWGRIVVGFVFFIPFLVYYFNGKIQNKDLHKYVGVVILMGIQGAMGWIMVKSGLQDRIFVDPVKLMLHLLFAAILLILVYRLALENLNAYSAKKFEPQKRNLLSGLLLLLLTQLCLGALVAGSRAALAFPTWPKMGEAWIPTGLLAQKPVLINFVNNLATMQFMHRMFAYFIAIYVIFIVVKFSKESGTLAFHNIRKLLLGVIFLQIALGIFTLLHSKIEIPIILGVLHQMGGMVLLLIATFMHFSYKYK